MHRIYQVFWCSKKRLPFSDVKKDVTNVLINTVALTQGILEQHDNVTLAIDILYITEIVFVVTKSWNTFIYCTAIENFDAVTIMSSLNQVISAYSAKVIKVKHIMGCGHE